MKKEFFKLTPFKMQVVQSFPFIDADFDALTNYELLCKVVDYLNKTVSNVDLLNEKVEEFQHYFDNLDVQEEINNKLDDMAESGELTDIIAQYLQLAGVLAYNTVADMKTAENLIAGSITKTLGFHTLGDDGGAFYKIRTVTNEDVVNQIMNYVDFIRDEYAAGDYGQIQAFIVANTIPDDVVQRKNEIAKRYYTIDKRPPKSKEWNDLTLVEYKYNAVTKKLEFEIK